MREKHPERERHPKRDKHPERDPNTVRERYVVRESKTGREWNIGREPIPESVHEEAKESEWTTVSHRKPRNFPPRRHGRSGKREEDHPQRRNWRDRTDITSFYFTRFHDEVTETELWTHFRKWGDVKEIFIPKRRNREGRRYGFVRYKGISDKRRIEKELDSSIVKGLKLHVNAPKYGRGQTMLEQYKIVPAKKGKGVDVYGQKEEAPLRTTGNKVLQKTYAEAVAVSSDRNTPGTTADVKLVSYGGPQPQITLKISEGDIRRYENTWVGRMKQLEIFERLEDEVLWKLGPGVSPKYLGDDMVLLLGLSDT